MPPLRTEFEMLQGHMLGGRASPYFGLPHPDLYAVRGVLGALPGTTSSGSLKPSTGPAPTPVATTGQQSLADNTCTTDRKMNWASGAWRVVSDIDKCPVTTPQPSSWTDVVTYDLESAGHAYFVGPFPIPAKLLIDPPDDAYFIATVDFPSDVPASWARPLRAMLDAAAQSQGAAGQLAQMGVDPNRIPSPHAMRWPSVLASNDPLCTGGGYPKHPERCAGYSPVWDGSTFKDVFGVTWSHGADQVGNQQTYVQHPVGLDPADTNTYKLTTYDDWAMALGLNMAELQALVNVGRSLGKDSMINWQGSVIDGSNLNIPPIAKWRHPKTGDTWGVWVSLATQEMVRSPGSPGTFGPVWNSGTDRPESLSLQFGFGKIPEAPWYDEALSILLWVPEQIIGAIGAAGDVIGDALQALLDFVCSDPQVAAQAIKSDPDMASKVAAQGGMVALQALCPRATAPPPMKTPPPTKIPWTWIIGGVALLGILIVATSPNKRREREAA